MQPMTLKTHCAIVVKAWDWSLSMNSKQAQLIRTRSDRITSFSERRTEYTMYSQLGFVMRVFSTNFTVTNVSSLAPR